MENQVKELKKIVSLKCQTYFGTTIENASKKSNLQSDLHDGERYTHR